MKVFLRLSVLVLVFLFPVSLFAQVPTPPPGFDQGPYITFDDKAPSKGQKLIQVTERGKKIAIKKFKRSAKKRGRKVRQPSPRQLNKAIAKLFGLRLSEEISSGNILYATGVRDNTTKITKALKKKWALYVEENYKIYKFDFIDIADDLFCFLTLCWGIENIPNPFFGSGVADMDVDAPDAWPITEGEGIVVGVIDTGVDYTHQDLADNIWTNPRETENGIDDDGNGFVDDIRGWDFFGDQSDPMDDNFHGTHVAGIIAALRGNQSGIIGVAPKAKILPLKVLGADGSGDTVGLIRALEYSIQLKEAGVPLRVLNASLGGGESTELIKQTIQRANDVGILFVAAAGNNSSDNDREAVYPANHAIELPNVLSVASIDSNGELSDFSNFGRTTVSLAAPGGFVWSTIIRGLYLPASGTSMAAPHAAGVAALVAARYPDMTPGEIRDRLMNTAKPVFGLENGMLAPGIVSAGRALQ